VENIHHILIADDDDDDRMFLTDALKEVLGKEVKITEAENGASFLNLLYKVPRLPDYIFMDLNMPRFNGFKCIEMIRENKHYNNIPIIVFSTSSNQADIDKSYKLGANLFITKPALHEEYLSLLKKVFKLSWEKYLPHPVKEEFVLTY
jgi:CheY-like chemotaxis protein